MLPITQSKILKQFSLMSSHSQLRNQYDRLGHRMWYNMVGGIHGWNAKLEDSSEFNVCTTLIVHTCRGERDKNHFFECSKEFNVFKFFSCFFSFQERRKSGVIMQATMTDDTRNKYMVRVDSKDFS